MDFNKDNILKNVDSDKAEVLNNLTQTETVRFLGRNDNPQKSIIKQLEEVLNFLKSEQIENEEDLNVIQKPLDDLQSSLKYIPTGQHFNHLPPEIKEDILSYLCDSNAFTAASVCEEWKEMLGSRFEEVDTVFIGKRKGDHKKYRCDESNDCADGISKHLSPEVMLKASADHKLIVHLRIDYNHRVTEVDSKVVTEGLLSVSRFSLFGRTSLSFDQLEDLFKGLEKGGKVMEEVNLFDMDLNELNQDRLVHCLMDKIKDLTLFEHRAFPLKLETLNQLLNSIATRPVKLKSLLFKYFYNYDFSTLINPEDLKKLINKMDKFRLEGIFTSEQIVAVKSLPYVKVHGPINLSTLKFIIKKGL